MAFDTIFRKDTDEHKKDSMSNRKYINRRDHYMSSTPTTELFHHIGEQSYFNVYILQGAEVLEVISLGQHGSNAVCAFSWTREEVHQSGSERVANIGGAKYPGSRELTATPKYTSNMVIHYLITFTSA